MYMWRLVIYTIMQGLKCRMLSFLCGRLTSSTCGMINSAIPKCNGKEFYGIQFLRSMSGRPWPTPADAAGSVAKRLGYEVVDAKGAIQSSKPSVKIVMDVGTSGPFGSERITEMAFGDLLGEENSCFHALVYPERIVTNSGIHGIKTDTVNQQNVSRIQDLIPRTIEFVESRQTTEGPVLFIAHNGFRFDYCLLFREFHRYSMQIPNHWRFLDTLPLGRELVRAGLKRMPGASLSKLCEHYNIPQEGLHRTMSDVNLLAQVFSRMTTDLKLDEAQLLERSLNVFQLHDFLTKPSKRS